MSSPKSTLLLVTCEHGGNEIPAEYASLFSGSKAQRSLASHRGFDPGALVAAELFATQAARLISATVSRLLVDLNRSLDNPNVFSEFSSRLSTSEKDSLLCKYYSPYRDAVTLEVAQNVRAGQHVLHLSVHSFTPVFAGQSRGIDIGWLYDPKRSRERNFSNTWLKAVQATAPKLRLRRNAPYKGTSDGFTTALRQTFSDDQYSGIELEISQGFSRNPNRLAKVTQLLNTTLQSVLAGQRDVQAGV